MAEPSDDIERYISGKMTAQERHALERKALSDPFLADALDGATSVSNNDFVSDVKSIRQQLPKIKAKTSWTFSLRIAASVALVLVTSYAIYRYSSNDNDSLQANQTPTLQPVAPEAKQSDTLQTTPKEGSKLLTYSPPAPRAKDKTEKEAPLVSDDKSLKQQKEQPNSSTGTGAVSASSLAYDAEAKKEIAGDEQASIPNKNEPALAKTEEPDLSDINRKSVEKKAAGISASDKKVTESRGKTIRGKVVSEEDNTPLPGVNIIDQATSNGTISNEKGEYELATSDQKDSIDFRFIGYKSKSVAIVSNDSPLNVSLEPDASSLSEVIVNGDSGLPAAGSVPAQPVDGTKAFKDYLSENLRYPLSAISKKTEGNVIVQFSVGTNGRLSAFSVVKGIGQGCDEEAVRLIADGPPWKASTSNGTPVQSSVRVKVKFRLPK